MVLIRAQTAITIRQTAVTVHFRSTQLLPFQSYYTLEMYKLNEFTMPLTAKAKNLLLIIQNVILLKIDILAKT